MGGARDRGLAAWRAKTEAQIHTPASFAALKVERGLSLLGLMGYAGRWQRSGLSGAALEAFVADAGAALRRSLEAAKAEHGERLVMVSGATDSGVLRLAYELAAELSITSMGITSNRALRYRVAPMHYLIAIGSRFGDESADFVTLCDHFVVLGGGAQSRHECELALAQGKPVEAITGFGGAADELAAAGEREGLRCVSGRASAR